MNTKRIGKYTLKFDSKPSILSHASVASKKESQGPLADMFDVINDDTTFGQTSWEKAESQMQKLAFHKALEKCELNLTDVDFIFAGDLLNQCVSSSFASRESQIPFMGVYGACSSMAETLILSSIMVDGGFATNTCAITSSHFCTAERQYRFPLEYGGQRPPYSQWTVTGSGCAIISDNQPNLPYIAYATCGKITDFGITDANNMGAAMAPSAYDTLTNFFADTNTKPTDYDLIVTGDLGKVGSDILKKLFAKDGVDISKTYDDCGLMIYDATQDVHAGGSGCGCSASVLCSYILNNMCNKTFKNVIFAGTGALLSPTTVLQGESIPSICHVVNIKID